MKALVFVAAIGAVAPVANAAQARRAAPPPATQAPSGSRASSPATASSGSKAEAYELFLRAHALENENVEEAIAAYKRAMALDPTASAIPADLADLYLQEERSTDAISAAEQALAISSDDRDAHRVLGTVYASLLGNRDVSRNQRQEYLTKAVQNLEQSFDGPIGAADPNMRALLARLYIASDAYDKAIPILSDLVKQEPQWTEGPNLLIQAYTEAGRAGEAKTWLEQNAPETPELYSSLGDVYARERRYDDAAGAYEEALKVSPRNARVRISLGRALLSTGNRENAVRARDVLKEITGPRIPDDALYYLSKAELQSGDSAEAESVARRLIAQNARAVDGYEALASALVEQRKYQPLVDSLAPAFETFSSGNNTGAVRMLAPYLGYAYQELGQYDKAIAAFETAQKAAPNDPAFTGYLIQAQMAAKNYGVAADLARAARAQRPNDLRLASLESLALRRGGKTDAGLAVLESFAKAQPDNADAVVTLAQAYSDANRGSQAVKVLRDAQTRFTGDTTIAFELGAVLDKQKKYSEAEAVFRDLIAKEPNNAVALNYLGYMLAERGERLTESVDLLKRALAIDPDNGSYLDSIGWAYFKDGKIDLALENLQKAAEQLTTNSVVQDHYGDVLFKAGRIDDAIGAWNRALAGDGDTIDKSDIDRKIRSARQKLPRR
jgi:tetratricopeptide (TPR) repeat protein